MLVPTRNRTLILQQTHAPHIEKMPAKQNPKICMCPLHSLFPSCANHVRKPVVKDAAHGKGMLSFLSLFSLSLSSIHKMTKKKEKKKKNSNRDKKQRSQNKFMAMSNKMLPSTTSLSLHILLLFWF